MRLRAGSGLRRKIKILLTKISPRIATSINYRYSCGEWLNWNEPQDINAKINWLKVNTYYNNALVTACIDKYLVRDYLKEKKLEYLAPRLYGVYDNPREIVWEDLPNQFVVKCNHACNTNLIVSDKAAFDSAVAIEKLDQWLELDYWKEGEVQYRFIKKKIIIEEYLGSGTDLKTVKFFCFNGEPKIAYISFDEDRYINYYDMAFNPIECQLYGHPNYPEEIEKPQSFERMIEIAKILSNDFPFVRVDLYDSYGEVFFSELTFVPTAGYMKITPESVMEEWNNWLILPKQGKHK